MNNDNVIPPQRKKTLDEIEQEELQGATLIEQPAIPTTSEPDPDFALLNQSLTPTHFLVHHPDELPRPETTEEAFRRYESILATALSRFQLEVDPSIISPRISARTFISRIRDAVLGFEKYGYKSYRIPSTAKLRYLKYTPLKGGIYGKGKVLITNTSRVPDSISNTVSASDIQQVHRICEGIENHEDRYMDDFYITFLNQAQESFILALEEQFPTVIVSKKNASTYHLHP